MRVIFLDYDGVVNSPDNNGVMNFPSDGCVNNFNAVALINQFCKSYHYVLVISSTWSRYENYKEVLMNAGLDEKVHILGKLDSQVDGRPEAISQFLKSHSGIENYLIFDDMECMGIHSSHHVLCNYEEGFTEQSYNEAARLHQLHLFLAGKPGGEKRFLFDNADEIFYVRNTDCLDAAEEMCTRENETI